MGFEKAAKMMNMDIIYVPLLETCNYEPDLKAYRKAINKNTVMIVASAPQYPQGLLDPIREIGKLATDFNVPLHVDACLGGFLLAFSQDFDGLFDFSVPGVTSISADTHKVRPLTLLIKQRLLKTA